ncbi:MAG TPA: NTP transferase domain-containing protein, partial [Usitatibacter sp.]|nr:NTP transferase domain-containing protein [Usitatibacter sp.]
GMGASLAAGVESAARADGWIVALGDMPSVSPETIRAIRSALEAGAAIAAPHDASGRRGHPVGFSKALGPELLAIDGDVGARAILERHRDAMVRITTGDPGIFVDIDTPQDLAALRGKASGV